MFLINVPRMLIFRQLQLACSDFVWEWRDPGTLPLHLTGRAVIEESWGVGDWRYKGEFSPCHLYEKKKVGTVDSWPVSFIGLKHPSYHSQGPLKKTVLDTTEKSYL